MLVRWSVDDTGVGRELALEREPKWVPDDGVFTGLVFPRWRFPGGRNEAYRSANSPV
jgi:hypothetical protein